jgi:CheY-like chemotaxis protein
MATQPPASPAPDAPKAAHPRILIADGEPDLRAALRLLLEDEGYEVLEAEDGIAALEVMTLSPTPLLVLLDLVMPKMSGYHVLLHASTDSHLMTRHVYLVLSAAQTTPKHLDPAVATLLTTHHIPVIAKPFGLDDVLAEVARLWRQLVPEQDEDAPAGQREGGVSRRATGGPSAPRNLPKSTSCRKDIRCRISTGGWRSFGHAPRPAWRIHGRRLKSPNWCSPRRASGDLGWPRGARAPRWRALLAAHLPPAARQRVLARTRAKEQANAAKRGPRRSSCPSASTGRSRGAPAVPGMGAAGTVTRRGCALTTRRGQRERTRFFRAFGPATPALLVIRYD